MMKKSSHYAESPFYPLIEMFDFIRETSSNLKLTSKFFSD